MLKRLLGTLALLTAAAGMPGAANAQINVPQELYTPKGPIEAKYVQPGPWAVSEMRTTGPCDSKGNACTIFYPTKLGSNPLKGMTSGFEHPVIAWANGSNGPTSQYVLLLRHWASWGFVSIATDDVATGLGATVTDATEYLIAQGDKPGSTFYRKLDRDKIGVSGHSQGAAAAMALLTRRPDLYKTAVPYNAPNVALGLVLGWNSAVQMALMTSGSILYMGSGLDPIADLSTQLAYYLTTAGVVDKAVGVLTLAGHEDLVHPTGPCDTANCLAGRGYPTAWMMWKLQGAADGPDAFRAGSGEFSRPHLLWGLALSNVQ